MVAIIIDRLPFVIVYKNKTHFIARNFLARKLLHCCFFFYIRKRYFCFPRDDDTQYIRITQ